jgi:hypothetical protein
VWKTTCSRKDRRQPIVKLTLPGPSTG